MTFSTKLRLSLIKDFEKYFFNGALEALGKNGLGNSQTAIGGQRSGRTRRRLGVPAHLCIEQKTWPHH